MYILSVNRLKRYLASGAFKHEIQNCGSESKVGTFLKMLLIHGPKIQPAGLVFENKTKKKGLKRHFIKDSLK
jgi:hypothetical protein